MLLVYPDEVSCIDQLPTIRLHHIAAGSKLLAVDRGKWRDPVRIQGYRAGGNLDLGVLMALWGVDGDVDWRRLAYEEGVIWVKVSDEDCLRPAVQVLLLSQVQKDLAVYQDAGVFAVAGRRFFNFAAGAEDLEVHNLFLQAKPNQTTGI